MLNQSNQKIRIYRKIMDPIFVMLMGIGGGIFGVIAGYMLGIILLGK